MEQVMIPPASPEAEANLSSPTSDAAAKLVSEPLSAPPMPHVAPGGFPPHTLTDIQEKVQEFMNERLRVLESQLLMGQQRYRDRIEEELHKMRQQLTATAREQRQQHQTMSAAFRETLEEMRKEFSESLCRLSRDVDHVLRQAEAQAKRAVEGLRDEMLQALFERDQATVKRQMLGELLVMLGQKLQATDEDDKL
jgi:cell division septum initiation protein DivIVA